MTRLDYAEMIRRLELPDGVWRWLDLLGDAIRATQEVTVTHKSYAADTPYKKLLVVSGNKQISNLNAIAFLLRCEMIHQAAAQVRLYCEALITLSFIGREPDTRSVQFWDYSKIDAFNAASSMLKEVRPSGHRDAIAGLEHFLDSIRAEYEKLYPTYTFVDRAGRHRPFSNWCNLTIAGQAAECGSDIATLYRAVYGQMSAYVHASAWSLRRQLSYSGQHYDESVVQNDVATVVRMTLAIWQPWANFYHRELGWELAGPAANVVAQCAALDTEYFRSRTDVDGSTLKATIYIFENDIQHITEFAR